MIMDLYAEIAAMHLISSDTDYLAKRREIIERIGGRAFLAILRATNNERRENARRRNTVDPEITPHGWSPQG